ncbi:hypothetical protein SAMN05421821_11960 [Mucilaginibacter lappiensis]|uniref:Nucleoside 2-deoxyribosyltransferase n=1 Tax=Mucilaginibacter lappiensis TaxID=354630 RepID=A0ABR6PS09_9SPHI|nr:hypothetical protein [Mucilaginibacter lappiensis]MBB6112525.1 nucleoside 2-deoxyribosyltransferase [Mucilaginibacter lappiensis]SIS02714.1 hypothetical protein SAMN05421821_11960 [Mucilaginibacter lappiensis]
MLEELFTAYGCTITRVGTGNETIACYRIRCKSINLDTSFNWYTNDNPIGKTLKGTLHGLLAVLFNGSTFDQYEVYDETKLQAFIRSHYVVLTPDEKLNSVLEYIQSLTTFDGQTVVLKRPTEIIIAKMYFYNVNEWSFYLSSTIEQGYVSERTISSPSPDPTTIKSHRLTVKGLSQLIKINASKKSKVCFIAMAFVSDMFEVLEDAIKPALTNTGFNHYVVSEEHVDSDKTLNDAIIAGIKKARFTIADFTYHRGGVYFEAGYALGRGQKVIYTCREDEMSKAHFDIRNYQHIVWSNASDFKQKLINKIEAFIKE